MIVMRVDTVITDNFCGNLEAASDEIETMRQLFTLRLRLDCFCAPCFLLLCLPRSEWFLCAFNSSYIVEILESLGFPIFFYSKNFNLDTAFYYFHPVVKDSLIYNLSGESLSLFLFFFLDPCPSFETSSSVWTSAFQGTWQSSLNIFRVSPSLWKSSFLSLSGEASILLSHDFLIHTNLAPSPVHGLSTVKFPGAFYIFNLQFLLNAAPLSLLLWSHIVTIILQFSSCHQVSD